MNISQFKQKLFNNLWYGENSRERNRAQHFPSAGFVLLESVTPDGAKVFGCDISHWNKPPVNLKRMVELHNLQFVVIKGCDGSVNTNYYFEHVAAAKEAGIPWGMYVWLYPAGKVNIDSQVNAWHARAIIDPPPLGIFIDAEWTYYGGVAANPNANDLRAAHDKIKVKQDKAATTYTAKGYADTYLKGFDWTREELWVANYGVTVPAMPNGATAYKWHQFTSTWMFDGVNYDGNYFNGSLAEFTARYGAVVPPPPPNGEPMRYTATALSDGTRLRPESNVNKTYISSHARNTKFSGDVLFIATAPTVPNQNVGDKWLQVKEINGVPFTGVGWVAITHLGAPVCTLVENVPPPPPVVDSITVDIAVGDVKTAGDRYEVKGVKAVKVA